MRGDAMLHLRLLARPRGLIAVVGALAGVGAFTAAYLPWYVVAAQLDMLGARRTRAVASLPAWEAHPWGWLVPALALVAVVSGVLFAIDRPLPLTRDLQLLAGIGLAGVVAAAALVFPPVSRFDVAGTRLRELADLAGRLPQDVELTFSVRPAMGMWITLSTAALIVLAALLTREPRWRP